MSRVTKKNVLAQVREIIDLIQTASLSGPDADPVAFRRRRIGQAAIHKIGESILNGGPSGIGFIKTDYAKTRFAEAGIVDLDFPAGTEQVTPKRMGGTIVLEGDTVITEVVFDCHVKKAEYKIKTQWVDIDADTRKRVPVLDENRQPIVKETNVGYEWALVTGRLPIPVSLIVDIMNEIGRPSLLEEADARYVPAPLGQALASLLPGSVMAQLMPPMVNVTPRRGQWRGMTYGDCGDMHDFFEMAMMAGRPIRPPIPCRVFLQPHDDGRTEIVAEPYSKAEIRQNQDEIVQKSDWSEWSVYRTEAVMTFNRERKLALPSPKTA